MKHKNLIVLIGSLLFILLNTIALAHELLYVPIISVVAVVAYLLIFRVDLAMYLMAFVTPFSFQLENEKINIGLSLPAELLMVALTLLFFCRLCYDLSLRRDLLKHPITITIFIYLFWMFITCITSEIPLVSFKFFASKIWFIVSSYFMVIYLMDKKLENWIRYFTCYAVALACVVIITTIKHAMVGFDGHIAHWIMSPYYNDHTAYGAILALFIPIVIGLLFLPEVKRPQKKLYVVLLGIYFVGFYLSFSRAAWLSLFGAMGIWVIVKLRIKFSWFITAVAILLAIFVSFSNDILYTMSRNNQDSSGDLVEHLQSISNISTDASNVERLNRWNSAFGMIAERPVQGWGPGTYQFVYAPFQDHRYHTIITTNLGDGGNAHSEYIGPCAETGFVGLATVLALVIVSLYYGLITYRNSRNKTVRILSLSATLALITYFIHGTMNNFLDTDKLSLPFWGLFALIAVLNVMYIDKSTDWQYTLEEQKN